MIPAGGGICGRKMMAPKTRIVGFDAAPDHIEVLPRNAILGQLLPMAHHDRHRRVEEGYTGLSAVYQQTSKIVDDRPVVGQQGPHSRPDSNTASVGDSGSGWVIAAPITAIACASTAAIKPSFEPKWCCTKPTDTPAESAIICNVASAVLCWGKHLHRSVEDPVLSRLL